MSASKKPRKKHRPGKIIEKSLRRQEGRCYIYRWESAVKLKNGAFSFAGHDTLTIDQQEQLMTRAMNSTREWVCLVHACYVTGTNDYYEETAEFVTPPVRLGQDAEAVDDLIQSAIREVRNAGNPNHYIDTVVVLRPATPDFRKMADDDEWLKKQAAYRSRVILETVGNDGLL